MQLNDLERAGISTRAELSCCAFDLWRTRQETEDLPARLAHSGPHRLDQGRRGHIADVERIQGARHVDDRTIIQKCRHPTGVERCRHHDDPKIRSCGRRLPGQREAEICVNAPLVELIENDGAKLRQERIGLQPRGQNTFGGQQHARVRSELSLEAHLPSDFPADGPALLARDSSRDVARGNPARLQHDDRSINGQRRRNSRRLASSRRGRHHHGAGLADSRQDLG